jgi:hypothetical protein
LTFVSAHISKAMTGMKDFSISLRAAGWRKPATSG